MILKHLKTIAVSAALISALSVSAYATSIGCATVNTGEQKLCTEPNPSSAVLGIVPQDSVVIVGEKVNEGWYRVVYCGATGYISSEFLNFSENLEGDFGSGNISGDDVCLYDNAGLFSNVV